ncbi:hypothetical protein AVEN_17133-1 [Araneus ventricosus]|uniref:Uncharacterized protein n=1 Tax=Araneus ventricosus TaxID=182803 RepID=A0A4Y2IJ97_ARAVE|nr:hypothetical protein AVEN_17133-1 [Araneus ventricosus]
MRTLSLFLCNETVPSGGKKSITRFEGIQPSSKKAYKIGNNLMFLAIPFRYHLIHGPVRGLGTTGVRLSAVTKDPIPWAMDLRGEDAAPPTRVSVLMRLRR